MTHFEFFVRGLAWRIAALLAVYLIGFIIESAGRVDNAPNHKGVLLNCLHLLVIHSVDLSLGVTMAYSLKLLIGQIPFYQPPIHFSGGAFAVFGLSCLAIASHDFFYYWFHRLQHSSKWLWAEHEFHHSDEHVNVTTTWRHHWLEQVLQPVFILTPVLLLFDAPMGSVIWLVLFAKGMGFFVHLNSPIRFGWFNRVLASPQSHRIHHSNSPEHFNKNFTVMLPLWDILFGTYHHPSEKEWPSTGVDGVTVTSLWQAAMMPFVSWSKMLRSAPSKFLTPVLHDAAGGSARSTRRAFD